MPLSISVLGMGQASFRVLKLLAYYSGDLINPKRSLGFE